MDQQYTKAVLSLLAEYKMQHEIEVQIEGNKDTEDYVTQWQEFITTKKGRRI